MTLESCWPAGALQRKLPVRATAQAVAEFAELTATSDREQAANEAEWDTLTKLIEADRRQQACCFPPSPLRRAFLLNHPAASPTQDAHPGSGSTLQGSQDCLQWSTAMPQWSMAEQRLVRLSAAAEHQRVLQAAALSKQAPAVASSRWQCGRVDQGYRGQPLTDARQVHSQVTLMRTLA